MISAMREFGQQTVQEGIWYGGSMTGSIPSVISSTSPLSPKHLSKTSVLAQAVDAICLVRGWAGMGGRD
jgi:hypothetical protein